MNCNKIFLDVFIISEENQRAAGLRNSVAHISSLEAELASQQNLELTPN